VAIALGGPGAVFWMWLIAFVGAGTAYAETALGQIYKEEIDGNYRGGPAYYILKGLKNRYFAMAFALVTIFSLGVLLPGVQSNAICEAFYNAFTIDKRITAGFVVALLSVVIFGGVKRLAKVAEYVTPFMAIGYLLIAGIILILNYQQIPAMFALIFKSAFGFEPAMSGMLGAAISTGVKRGVFSNEAGQGCAPHAAAACEVSHPAQQGLVQAFSVYVDTLLVCSATALMILSTDMYNVYDSTGNVVFSGGGLPLSMNEYGPVYTQLAVDATIPGFGSAFVAVTLFFFAITTLISDYFQAESNVYFIFRKKNTAVYMVNFLRMAVLIVAFFTAINTMTLAWDLADIGVGIMAWFNLIALAFLHKTTLKTFADFEKQRKSGIAHPVFRSKETGIENAKEWEKER
jgi:AGCS family alanine or glycine:cation symporter